MLRTYSDTDMVWDTDKGKWFRPRKQYVPVKQWVTQPVKKQWTDQDFSKMTYREYVFQIYKNCRDGIGWLNIYNAFGDDDRGYFDLLDKLAGVKTL